MDTKENHAAAHGQSGDQAMQHKNSYRNLLIMTIFAFVSMYILMYAMVDVFGNVINNLNQVYMAGLMTAPMVVIELILMRMMYPNKRMNTLIMSASVVIGLIFFTLVRQQAAITDKQFLKSMSPHHGAAILMCEQAPIADPEIKGLCGEIISSQQAEIDQMRA